MMLKSVLLFAVVAAVSAVPHKLNKLTKNSRLPVDNSDIYDCKGKPNGNYYHPEECTRFIMCTEGRTVDMPCGDCGNNPQCNGLLFLVYNKEQDKCLWPNETECIVDPQDPPEEPTTEDSVVEPVDPEPVDPEPVDPEPVDPEPVDPEPVDPEEPEERCAGRTEGAVCQPEDCEHCGWCENFNSSFFRCQRTFPEDPKDKITGIIVLEHCDADLWWNPDVKPKDAQFGGTCTPWSELSDTVKDKYKSDENCVHPICEWGQDEPCSGDYWYYDPKVHGKGDRSDYSCPIGLLWDPSKETCANRVHGC